MCILIITSKFIKGEIQNDETFQPQPQPKTTLKFYLCSVAKLKQVRVRLGFVRFRYGLCFCHTENPEQRRAQHILYIIKFKISLNKIEQNFCFK
jgi:hypothetical protein